MVRQKGKGAGFFPRRGLGGGKWEGRGNRHTPTIKKQRRNKAGRKEIVNPEEIRRRKEILLRKAGNRLLRRCRCPRRKGGKTKKDPDGI